METLIIDKKKFLDWYHGDVDFTASVINALLVYGEYKFTIDELLDSVGYIPEEVLVDGQQYSLDSFGDVDTSDFLLKFN